MAQRRPSGATASGSCPRHGSKSSPPATLIPQRPRWLGTSSSASRSAWLQCVPAVHSAVEYWVTVMDTPSTKHSYIIFLDEAGFMLSPLVRRTWAPRGHTPVIKVTSPHERISAIGAMTLIEDPIRFGFQFHLLQDNANFEGLSVARFIDDVRRRLRSPMTLIWDELRIHSARPVKDYLAKCPNIAVEELPPYAPELNPVDQVWSYVKYARLANYCPHSLFELRERVTAELTRVKRRPALLRSLFSRTGLALDD